VKVSSELVVEPGVLELHVEEMLAARQRVMIRILCKNEQLMN
jgi:hypothetical protein